MPDHIRWRWRCLTKRRAGIIIICAHFLFNWVFSRSAPTHVISMKKKNYFQSNDNCDFFHSVHWLVHLFICSRTIFSVIVVVTIIVTIVVANIWAYLVDVSGKPMAQAPCVYVHYTAFKRRTIKQTDTFAHMYNVKNERAHALLGLCFIICSRIRYDDNNWHTYSIIFLHRHGRQLAKR